MRRQFYFLLSSLLFCVSIGRAQIYDLDELRYRPDSNSLKVEKPELGIRPVKLPMSNLDLKVIYWRHWSSFGINANQASFSDNWQTGGVNSISVGLLLNHKSDYTRNNTNFVTELNLQYGKQKNKEQLPRKNNDRIFWDNKLSLKVANHWSLFTSLTFESQFDIGWNYGVNEVTGREETTTVKSNFMAPGYLAESLGIEYKPDNTFSLRIGTGTARQTFVSDDNVVPTAGDGSRYGVEPGKHFRNDLAFQLTALLDRNIAQNINLKSRYNMFANYEELTDPSHRLEATLTASVTRLINVTLAGILVYDSRQHENIQTSQALALGLLYKIPR
ncbi:hypothetical protein GCM10011386_32790 [Parapedobacter defluvii]|uniref:DUF3078 domain-containing protein n=1 Tax=Parapedobacter defluvii TaxID=2045106 RepID=A0ABQ1MFH3_9SPHI|nr:DUF3078 domain-containing protein [Parapedobacter defluvii]GGC38141.1 hypothetical protein GCM10011386_32790 [Parapedobacter defluvii]